MNLKLSKYLSLFLLLTAISFIDIKAEGGDKNNTQSLWKITGEPSYKRLNINNISTWVKNDGESDINPNGNSGFIFPKGSNKAAVFQSGFLWGGRVDGQVRVGGSVYRQGLVPGKITNSGVAWQNLTAEDPNAANVRNYRVRPDINPNNPGVGDLSSEIADGEGTAAEIRAAYEKDWNEWPAADGAPFTDNNGNGTYEPSVDIPGFPGADQTIWFVANDTDEDQSRFMYGSDPMGIEMQATIWAYNRTGALGNMIFRSYKIINKSSSTFDNMYVSMWNDPDLGDASDDFVGCDTTLSMTFVYNANANDATYGQSPASSGFDFFQGPVVDSPGDSAIFKGRRIYDKRNLPMTAHYFFINSDPIYTDPAQGVYATGTLQWYNLLQGRVGSTGEVFPVPTEAGGGNTVFALSGDPLTGSGWVDGLQHPPGDRRAGMSSGPFNMAPGDTQEIVVAEVAAGGFDPVDRLSAVSLLKFYDAQAQIVYDNFFVVPAPPPTPQVTYTPLDQKIVLHWGSNVDAFSATESFEGSGYQFQGYNIYQLPSRDATITEARRIATFDLVDGIGKITSLEFDTQTGVVGETVTQFGTDSGIKRYLVITGDAFRSNLPLANGSRYYYAVTAYAFNGLQGTASNYVENPLSIIEAIPQSPNPGVRLGDDTGELAENNIVHSGTANASVEVTVVDPTQLTGHQYEVFFNQQHYYLGADNVWHMTNFPDSIGKVGDVSPSTLDAVAVYGVAANTIDVNLVLNLDSPTNAWVDGITVTFPAGTQVIDAPVVHAGGGDVTPVINGNVVQYGIVDDTTLTENGVFHGGEVLSITVPTFTLPYNINYIIHDDGYDEDSVGLPPVNAVGVATVTEFGNYFVTQDHWNVRDLTTGEVVLEDQTIWGGVDLYAGVFGPGGSSGTDFQNVGEEANVIFDGLMLSVSGSFVAPINFSSATLTRGPGSNSSLTTSGTGSDPARTRLVNYTVFAATISSKAIDNFNIGTNVIEELQQDYELRFTGIQDTIVLPGGQRTVQTVSGGQMATIFSTVTGGAGLANHPLNPNPGTAAPFLIRIPFEVWNISDPANPRQVNLMFRDREQAPTADPFRAWNTEARMYAVIVNSNYDSATVIPSTAGPLNALATWVLVFYSTRNSLGDVITIRYANPIQPGIDKFTITAPSSVSFSSDAAKEDVEKVNVFPNPYYGVNPQELNKYQRFVTFNHLPENNVTIRIFNLAGQLVRTIEKNTPGQFQRWDLLTDSGLPVASGLYIVYIDMPDLGKVKILKAAIIQEQQVLDRF
jgi:hypothetical protein